MTGDVFPSTTSVVIRVRVRPLGAGALGAGSAGHRKAAVSVGSARVSVVEALVERVDGQDRALGVVSRREADGLPAMVVEVAANGQASGSTSGCVNRTGLPSDRA